LDPEPPILVNYWTEYGKERPYWPCIGPKGTHFGQLLEIQHIQDKVEGCWPNILPEVCPNIHIWHIVTENGKERPYWPCIGPKRYPFSSTPGTTTRRSKNGGMLATFFTSQTFLPPNIHTRWHIVTEYGKGTPYWPCIGPKGSHFGQLL
jgi:hypothetical protein